jgi:hypothetical protein
VLTGKFGVLTENLICFPDPEELQKLLENFLQIYEFFENSGNSFRITQTSFRIRKSEKFVLPG